MPEYWLLFLAVGFWLFVLSWQAVRRHRRDGLAIYPALIHSPLLYAFLSTLGAMWLLPWAAHLPAAEPWALLPGLGFIALIAVGVRYAQRIAPRR